jgi:hypothetical protein
VPVPDNIAGKYLFDRPGFYQIRIVGELSGSWIDHFEGLKILINPWGNYPRVTQISGLLDDQTALSGLLDLLTDLGMVILTVERCELDEEIE